MTTPANHPPVRKTDTPPVQFPGETIDPIPEQPPTPAPDPKSDPRTDPTRDPSIEPGTSTPDEVVDRESEDSFPASDPPSTTPLHAGEPDLDPEPKTTPHEP